MNAFSAHAGLGRGWDYLTELETMSYGTESLMTLKGCQDVDPHAGDLAMATAENNCSQARGSIASQTGQLSAITAALRGDLEDRYFALVAKQEALEYHCAAQFAETLANQAGDERKIIANGIRRYRAAKRRVNEISQEISQNPAVLTKFCPLRREDLQPGQDKLSDRLCLELIEERLKAALEQEHIPLVALKSMRKFVDDYAAKPDGAKFDHYDKNLEWHLAAAMQNSADELTVYQKDFDERVRTQGGKGFSRDERHDLLSDPRVVAKVNAYGANDPAFMGIACRANYRYGSGADKLSLAGDLAEGSTYALGAWGLAKLLVKGGLSAARASWTARTARAVRAGGKYSARGIRLLLGAGAIAGGTGVSLAEIHSTIEKTCGRNVAAVDRFHQCVSAPKVEDVKRDDCVLRVTLDAIRYQPK